MSIRRLLPFFLLLACVAGLRAHDPGLSTVALKLERDHLEASLTFSPVDLEALIAIDAGQDGQISAVEFQASRAQLEALALEALQLQLDGRPAAASRAVAERVQLAANDNIQLQLEFPFESAPSRLSVESRWLRSLPLGHRQYWSLHNAVGHSLGEGLLDAKNRFFETSASPEAQPPPDRSFSSFLALGVEHILTGYDHLLFLFALLIVGGSLASAAKIITSFTLAHSVTLALATFHLVEMPSRVVEALIAASIVYVGLENLFRPNLKHRWMLTFAFGLVHGLGFASVLRGLGIGSQGGAVVAPLLAFNLGVELGQLAIAAMVLALLAKLNRQQSFTARYAPAGSWMVALMGTYWLVERTLT